jgi:hypothetical protein
MATDPEKACEETEDILEEVMDECGQRLPEGLGGLVRDGLVRAWLRGAGVHSEVESILHQSFPAENPEEKPSLVGDTTILLRELLDAMFGPDREEG